MLVVSVFKGSEKQMQVFGMPFTYALIIFFGLVVIAGGYIIASIALGLGFIGLIATMGIFGVFAYSVYKVSKRYGRGGFQKAYARQKYPEVIRGGVTQPSRLKYIKVCSEVKRK